MKHIEFHLIETPHDEHLATTAGLDVYEDDSCANCASSVGMASSKFRPYVIRLDGEGTGEGDNSKTICVECASIVL